MKTHAVAFQWLVALSILSLGPYPAAADTRTKLKTEISCPTSKSLADLVAESDLIVVAIPEVPVKLLESAMQEQSPGYVDVQLRQPSILKGADAGPSFSVKVYPKKTTHAPAPEALLERIGKPTLLFLTRIDQGPIGIYLSQDVDALQSASTMQVDAVKAEVERQQTITAAPAPAASLPHFKQVHDLLTALPEATPEREMESFRKLEALGLDGVPAIVAQMDDRRPLAVPQITLVNHDPNAFEGLRHYGPEVVVDALDAILNQITGFGGFIVNGGSERERQAAVHAWQVYAADMACH